MSNNIVLITLCLLGLGAFALGFSEKTVKEDWAIPGFGFSSVSQIGLKEAPNNQQFSRSASQNFSHGPEYSPNFAETPKYTSAILGSNPVVQGSQFVSYPSYQQSTPLRSPSLALPPMIKYKPPTLNEMGITNAYKCGESQESTIKEPYVNRTDLNDSYTKKDMFESYDNPNPKVGCGPFAAGNYNQVVCANSQPLVDAIENTIEVAGDDGQLKKMVAFDRPITVPTKAGRFRQKGVADYIRGDPAIAPNNFGWFQSSAKPAETLLSGAMNVLCGRNEQSDDFANFMKSYGSLSTTFGGVEWKKPEYNAMSMKSYQNGGIQDTASVVAFA